MRLILITASLGPGGAERVLSEMANYWADRGWEVTLATWSGPEIADFYPVDERIHRVWLNIQVRGLRWWFRPMANWQRVRKLRRLILLQQPEAVISFLDWSNVLAIIASTGTGVRTIVSERTSPEHNHTLGRPWRWGRRLTYRFAHCVVAQTDVARQWLADHCGAVTVTIPNPLRSLPPPGADEARVNTLLAVGRLSAEKGFDTLLRAYAALGAVAGAWRLRIIGAGPCREELGQLAETLGIARSVQFDEPVKNVAEPMSEAKVFALASRFEGFPNALVEAMAMGLAVVSTDCPAGPSAIVKDKINGLLVPVDDPASFAAALSSLIEDDTLRRRLAAEAVAVRGTYEQSHIMRQWETVVAANSGVSVATQ